MSATTSRLKREPCVVKPVRMDAQDRRNRPVMRRTGQEAANCLSACGDELELFQNDAVAGRRAARPQAERMLADLECLA
jgi:hypothetical protein